MDQKRKITNTYFVSKSDAKIFDSIPEVKRRALSSEIIHPFPQILEYGKQKFDKIFLNSLNLHYNKGIEICFIHKGCYHWVVEENEFTLYPGDAFITCPWELHGSKGGFLDLGILSWLIIQPEQFGKTKKLKFGDWSSLPEDEQAIIGKILNNQCNHTFHNPLIGDLMDQIFYEMMNTKLGYKKRINSLIEDIFIISARSFLNEACMEESGSFFDIQGFQDKLTSNLDHPWTLNEMAALVNMGITNFIDKTKQLTGLTPINLLIDLRIKESINQIQKSDKSLTEIAYECGFSSLQHFSDTFRKRVGISPSAYQRQISTGG